ncbi:hypothetical protein [Legionella gresilensis]|uniref:hypothetical protein n=1 Tax=Legionella gresilensis TaxID=91823 RepID=UPI0010416DBC|nr:hypothetical protein [Legionella gresilensis]
MNQPEGIIIQVEKKHYKPYLRNINRFQALPADTNPLQPKEYEVMDPPLETILERINAEDQRLIQDFEKNKVWLENLINDNEISVDELIDVYIEGMKHSDYLEGRINSKYIGIEHGYENFFSAIKNAQHQKQKGLVKDTTQTYNFESSVTQGLIHALARAISIGQLNADSISDSLERAPHKSMLNQG